MATKQTPTNDRQPDDNARFEAWLKDFDARQAQLSARLDAVLYSLGVTPNAGRETA
jgi:hypothetical protein